MILDGLCAFTTHLCGFLMDMAFIVIIEILFALGIGKLTTKTLSILNNLYVCLLQVFSVSLHGRGSKPLADGQEVVYRIHTPDRRGKPRQSLCLLWNQAAKR